MLIVWPHFRFCPLCRISIYRNRNIDWRTRSAIENPRYTITKAVLLRHVTPKATFSITARTSHDCQRILEHLCNFYKFTFGTMWLELATAAGLMSVPVSWHTSWPRKFFIRTQLAEKYSTGDFILYSTKINTSRNGGRQTEN